MGRIYLEHLGGSKFLVCTECDTFLTNENHIFSKNRRSPTGLAFLVGKIVNVTYGQALKNSCDDFVKSISCKKCSTKLGFFYEFMAVEIKQHLEGCAILEKSRVHQENVIEDNERKL